MRTVNYMVAQAKHETANFSSPIYLDNNNLFGLKASFNRKRFHRGTSRGHAVYDNLWDSISDYIDLLRTVGFPKRYRSVYGFALALKDIGYMEDSVANYVNGLNRFL